MRNKAAKWIGLAFVGAGALGAWLVFSMRTPRMPDRPSDVPPSGWLVEEDADLAAAQPDPPPPPEEGAAEVSLATDAPVVPAEPGIPASEYGLANPVEMARRGEASDRAALLAHFANTAIPLRRRKEDIQLLTRARNDASKEALMALGDARLYLNRYAVEALGGYRDEDTRRYLQNKLREPDALIVCAAVRALARSAGVGAVADVADVIRSNRRRADGHDEMVCQAAVETLGHIASARAIPVLTEELARSEEPGWSMEYGSAVLSALRGMPGPESRAAVVAYADRLAARLPDDPLARSHFETKIKEARDAAEEMER